MIVEGHVVAYHHDVVSREPLRRFDPKRSNPGPRIRFQKSIGEDMARSTGKEDSIRQRPTASRILLHSVSDNIHGDSSKSNRVRMSDSSARHRAVSAALAGLR